MDYKQIGEEMQKGLKNIYQQISASTGSAAQGKKDTRSLFTEASSQLSEVVQATEAAAMNIMDLVERQAENAQRSGQILNELEKSAPGLEQLEELKALNSQLVTALEQILTALSFQDITGQRLKKVTGALAEIESSVLELYLESGLVLQAAAEGRKGDTGSLQEKARLAVEDFREKGQIQSELKGPDKDGMDQDAIDKLLAQLDRKA